MKNPDRKRGWNEDSTGNLLLRPDRRLDMKVERPRAARYALVVPVILTDLETGHQIQENTWDVSLFGCQVMRGNGTRIGARVRIQINHKGDAFEALGRVMNVRPLMGAGIVFTKIEDKHQAILEKWLEGLRNGDSHRDDPIR